MSLQLQDILPCKRVWACKKKSDPFIDGVTVKVEERQKMGLSWFRVNMKQSSRYLPHLGA